jgi:hypothetical protein
MVRRDLQAIARLMPAGKSPAEIARETGTDERRLVRAVVLVAVVSGAR